MKKWFDFFWLGFLCKIEICYWFINFFILVLLVLLVILGLLVYCEIICVIQEKVYIYLVQVVKQIFQNLMLCMEKIEDISEELVFFDKLQCLLGDYYSGDEVISVVVCSGVVCVLLDIYGLLLDVNQKYLLDCKCQVIDLQIFVLLVSNIICVVEEVLDFGGCGWWMFYNGGYGQKSVVMLCEICFIGNNCVVGVFFVGVWLSYFFSIFEGVDLGYDFSLFIVDVSDGMVVVQGCDISFSCVDLVLLEGIMVSVG